MSTQGHTPGPWFLGRTLTEKSQHQEADKFYAGITTAPPPQSRQHVVTLDFGYGQKADEANARLIAAAPDMLEALKPFANFACDEPHVDEPECHNCRARAAIAKAEGKAT